MRPGERRCVSCGKIASKASFWRVVRLHPSHSVELDQGVGRSAYLCPQDNCLRTAERKRRLERALKASVPKPLYQSLWGRLTAEAGTTSLIQALPPTISSQRDR